MQDFFFNTVKKAQESNIFNSIRSFKKVVEEVEFIQDILKEEAHCDIGALYDTAKYNFLYLIKQNLLSDFETKKEFLFQVQTGNGGNDAEELSLILLKVYLQYFTKKKIKFSIIDISYSDYGLKKAIVKVDCEVLGFFFEEGVHRFIRISPFNKKRQTSFVSFSIYPYVSEQDKNIIIDEKDLKIDVFRASGAGGQHVNTTESAVRITHIPTGVVVQCQNERSQHQNKSIAMDVLRSLLLKKKQKELENQNSKEKQLISWSNHFRSYIFNPNKRIKDDRIDINLTSINEFNTFFEGKIDLFLEKGLWEFIDNKISEKKTTLLN